MSIFEPIPRESHWDDEEEDEEDDFPPADGFDPRSITIAGIVVAGIVVLGLVVSNTAERDPQQRPMVPSVQTGPGAADVEQAEVHGSAPTAAPSPTPSAPVVEADDDSIEPVNGGDDGRSDRSKGDDKPGKGNGRGR